MSATGIGIIGLAVGLALLGFLIGWALGYRDGAADAREQAADSFTRYLRRQELKS